MTMLNAVIGSWSKLEGWANLDGPKSHQMGCSTRYGLMSPTLKSKARLEMGSSHIEWAARPNMVSRARLLSPLGESQLSKKLCVDPARTQSLVQDGSATGTYSRTLGHMPFGG